MCWEPDRERPRLHGLDGPAVRFRDGWSVYAVRGVRVPEKIVEHPELVTVADIDGERNAEVRRVMLERFGVERYVTGNLAPIHEDECGRLYRRELDGDEPLCVVRVVNSMPEPDGTNRIYFLRVPPTVQTAREAVAWTFDVPAESYRPEAQT